MFAFCGMSFRTFFTAMPYRLPPNVYVAAAYRGDQKHFAEKLAAFTPAKGNTPLQDGGSRLVQLPSISAKDSADACLADLARELVTALTAQRAEAGSGHR